MKQIKRNQKALFQTVIVGVDFSKYSKVVLKQATELAKQFNAKLVVVYANLGEYLTASPDFIIPAEFPTTDEVKKAIQSFYQIENSEKNEIVVGEGLPAKTILRVASQAPNPLIIVGSQGKSAVSRYILGSHAESIALQSPYPVWVHRGKRTVPLKRVLVPTDLSSSSYKQIGKLQKWQHKSPLSLNYLFVKPEISPILSYPTYKEMAREFNSSIRKAINSFNNRGLQVPLITRVGNDPSQEISRLAKKYDVIAMNPHHRSGILNKFGRITSKVIRLSDNPVLVMKN